MIQRALIQESGNGRLQPEMRDASDELRARGVPVELFTEKRLTRRQLPLSRDALVIGFMPVVLGALRQLEIELPVLDGYPLSLRPFLYRRVWESTVGELGARLHEGTEAPIFARPKVRMKRFTGSVFTSPSDIPLLENASHRTPVYCAEVVSWRSEYRVFVVRGKIAGIRHYAGNIGVPVDEDVIAEAIEAYQASGEAPAGYGIDCGVLGSGETALVEVNDGFSLGAYGLNRSAYTDLLLARWGELMGME